MVLRLVTAAALLRIGILLGVVLLLVGVAWFVMLRMPGRSHAGTPEEARGHPLAGELRRDLALLAGDIGERNVFRPRAMERTVAWLEKGLADAGYAPRRHAFEASGTRCFNLAAELRGGSEIVLVGAHYDTVPGCPGANDNGSGVVGTLALARAWAGRTPRRTVRFVFFANEEPPFFQTDRMGSRIYARECKAKGEDIVAMISLETIGYFSDEENSQSYPIRPLRLIYPTRGNYIGFVGNVGSRALVRRCVEVFRREARLPSEGAALPDLVPGVGWSDHWSFWQEGYPALMVTDTAPFRYPYYHTPEDTPDRIDYERMALVVEGVEKVLADLAR